MMRMYQPGLRHTGQQWHINHSRSNASRDYYIIDADRLWQCASLPFDMLPKPAIFNRNFLVMNFNWRMGIVLLAALLLLSGVESAIASQQQCEALQKQFSANTAKFDRSDKPEKSESEKLTAQECRDFREYIKIYGTYQSQADSLNCAFAYHEGKRIGGAHERAELMADLRKELKKSCS